MPIYEFRCRDCGSRFEALRPMGDEGKDLDCPACGSGSPEKLVSVFAASTAGSGAESCSVPSSCGSGFA